MQDLPNHAPLDPVTEMFQRLSTPLFFACIAIGLGLLAYGLFSRSPAAGRKRFVVGGGALLCLMAAAFCQLQIDNDRGFIADHERRLDEKLKTLSREKGKEEALKMQYMYMPTGNSLYYITLGNPSLAADYVWLTSLQYVSNSFRRGEKFELLSRFYRTMIDLDPHWVDAEINGGKVLSALMEEREKSEECYLYAVRQNPTSWKLMNELGMLYVMPPSDPKKMVEYSRKAANYFELTRKLKTCPKDMYQALDDRIARLRLESGSAYYQEADALLWKNATDPDSPASLKDISKRDWLKAHSMALAATLTDTAAEQKKKTGRYPATLEELVASAHFEKPEAFAKDAYGFPFDYDPKSGEVSSHGANALRAVQAGHVINELLAMFKNEHHDRSPKDLQELREFLQTADGPPIKPPSVMLLDALGTDLDPVNGPLGPWQYDAAKGEIIMPPEADARKLYAHVADHFK